MTKVSVVRYRSKIFSNSIFCRQRLFHRSTPVGCRFLDRWTAYRSGVQVNDCLENGSNVIRRSITWLCSGNGVQQLAARSTWLQRLARLITWGMRESASRGRRSLVRRTVYREALFHLRVGLVESMKKIISNSAPHVSRTRDSSRRSASSCLALATCRAWLGCCSTGNGLWGQHSLYRLWWAAAVVLTWSYRRLTIVDAR